MQLLPTSVRNIQLQLEFLHHTVSQRKTEIMISTAQEAIPELDVDQKVIQVKKVSQVEMV